MNSAAPRQSQEDHNFHPAYRPDIDGLRAIAILSVVVFHAFPSGLQGGFVGVDIFFVISGFLISSIIFRSLYRGDFKFTEFYAHRIKRIFPALIVVLAASFVFGWFALLADEYEQLGKHMAAGAGFVQNFVLWQEAGYFDTASELKPLMHLWSLAIEEQFYLAYPVLIWAAWRLGLNVLTLVFLLGILSFLANAIGVNEDAVKTFFVPLTRGWELLAGSVLAYAYLFKRGTLVNWLNRWLFHPVVFRQPPLAVHREAALNDLLSVLGLLLLLTAVFAIHKGLAFPGWWALAPVAGAVLLILAGPEAWVNRKILAHRIMVFVGLISYPLYLWHWPILSFARIMESKLPTAGFRVAAVGLSFLLAWLTYRIIEKPIRFGPKTWIKTAALTALLAVMGGLGYNAYQRHGLEFRVKKFTTVSKAAGEWQYPGALSRQDINGIDYLFQKSGSGKATFFIGDSNMEQYYVRLDELIKIDPDHTNSIIFKTGGGCLPIPKVEHDQEHKHCVNMMRDALEIVKQQKDVEAVVIGGQWNAYLRDGQALVGDYKYGSPAYRKALEDLRGYILELTKSGKRVYVVLNIPTGNELDPKFIVKRAITSFPDMLQLRSGGISRALLEKAYGSIQSDLATMAASAGAQVIRPADHLCSATTCDSLEDDGEPIYRDAVHLRPSFVRRKADFMDITVR